jgi:hypothetical protein
MFKYISRFKSINFLAAFILINAIGCESETLIPEIKYNTVSKKDGNCDVDTIANCVKIEISYPEMTNFANEEVKNLINKKMVAQISQPVFDKSGSETVKEMMTSFINEYNLFIKETDYPMNWELSRSIEVQYSDEKIFSVSFTEYSYLGGAHPNSYTVFTVLELNSGNKITLEDIFIANYEPILNKIAEQEFRKLKELEEYEDLDEAGFWFDDNKFSINDNFALSDEGLTFYYNNYEITAYAYGPTELIIPLAKISQLIKDGGILAEFMKQ